MNVIFIEPALIELDDAVRYYNEELGGLGNKFYDEVLITIGLIKLFPASWNQCSPNTRKAILKVFPFNIIYTIDKNIIVIIAIAHHHRKPEYWIDRIK